MSASDRSWQKIKNIRQRAHSARTMQSRDMEAEMNTEQGLWAFGLEFPDDSAKLAILLAFALLIVVAALWSATWILMRRKLKISVRGRHKSLEVELNAPDASDPPDARDSEPPAPKLPRDRAVFRRSSASIPAKSRKPDPAA